MTVTIKRLCARCHTELLESAFYCTECGYGPNAPIIVKQEKPEPETKKAIQRGIARRPSFTASGHLMVQPTGFYNAPIEQTGLNKSLSFRILVCAVCLMTSLAIKLFWIIIGLSVLLALYFGISILLGLH